LKKIFIISIVILFVFNSFFILAAQEAESFDDIDMDSIDDLFAEEVELESTDSDTSTSDTSTSLSEQDETIDLLAELTTKTGGSFTASYAFAAGFAPGWSEAPWYWDDEEEVRTNIIGADLTSSFALDFQLSPQLRAYQSFSCNFPDYTISLGSFWAEYNFSNLAWFKLGQYSESWGLGGNYGYANILSRLPESGSSGDAYTLRMNLPFGVGGFQFLTMTRGGWVEGGNIENIEADDLGYGIKYNYAHPLADVNLGLLYQEQMPVRIISTLKSTLFDSTELYLQGLVAFPYDEYDSKTVYSGSVALIDEFFSDKLKVNFEYFYNAEVYTDEVETESGWTVDESSPYIKGHNFALNLYYNIGFKNLSVFSRMLYNYDDNTGKWAPGFRFKPFDDLSVYLSVPMAIGDRDGTYYTSNYDEKNRPFSVTLAVTLSGSQKFAHYE